MNIVSILQGLGGILFLVLFATLFSNNRRKINIPLVLKGISLQLTFAFLILKGKELGEFFFLFGLPSLFFEYVAKGFVLILGFTTEGAKFVFGNLAINSGPESIGFFFAFQVLPTIIFFSSVMAILYHLGVMQKVVQGMAYIMARVLGTSGAESLSNTANIFVGQTEAPLMIRPYVGTMTNSELLTIMTGGMATIAGGVLAAYVQMLTQSYSVMHSLSLEQAQIQFATFLLGASVMAAPASIVISKIIYPETEEPLTRGSVKVHVEKTSSNVIESAANGASDGLQLALNVGGMLLAFIALIALLNALLMGIGDLLGVNQFLIESYNKPLSMELIFGFFLQVVALAIGVPAQDAFSFGSLIGSKVVLNEFVAYSQMSDFIAKGILSTDKAIAMATFALCGFANFASIAIQIGGISPMAPHRKKDLSSLGLRAVLGGTIATLMTASLCGMFY